MNMLRACLIAASLLSLSACGHYQPPGGGLWKAVRALP